MGWHCCGSVNRSHPCSISAVVLALCSLPARGMLCAGRGAGCSYMPNFTLFPS